MYFFFINIIIIKPNAYFLLNYVTMSFWLLRSHPLPCDNTETKRDCCRTSEMVPPFLPRFYLPLALLYFSVRVVEDRWTCTHNTHNTHQIRLRPKTSTCICTVIVLFLHFSRHPSRQKLAKTQYDQLKFFRWLASQREEWILNNAYIIIFLRVRM